MLSIAGPSCDGSGQPGVDTASPSERATGSTAPPFAPAGIAGRWRFVALSGVPPEELPEGAVPDNRHDLVITQEGTFRWGRWSGTVSGAGTRFAMDVTAPTSLAERFDDYGAAIGLLREGDGLRIWLPDLGQDRDVDLGSAVEDIDSPDMVFTRV